MCSKYVVLSDFCCLDAVLKTKGNHDFNVSRCLIHISIGSQFSSVSTMSEISASNLVYKRKQALKSPASGPSGHYYASLPPDEIKYVYQRRKLEENSAPNIVCRRRIVPKSPSGHYSASLHPDEIKYVYKRRKLQKNSGISAQVSADPLSANPSCIGMEEGSKHVSSSMSVIICNLDPLATYSETGDGRVVVENRAFDGQSKLQKSVKSGSVDDSCSSSILNIDIGSSGLKTGVDDTGECSSSGALNEEAFGENLSEKELCIKILLRHGILSSARKTRLHIVGDDLPSCCGSSNYRACKSCGNKEDVSKMLICDLCEAAFHILCCDPSMRKILDDEWHCPSCCNKKRKIMRETPGKSRIMRTDSQYGFGKAKDDCGPIASMLGDTEPYRSKVRVGKGFQADVPVWTGPVSGAFDVMQLEALNPCNQGYNLIKPPRTDAMCNWLQCRQVIHGLDKGIDGTICRKWRRAPASEVQTDNWDCFRCVLWDPLHADCAVPQTRPRKRQR